MPTRLSSTRTASPVTRSSKADASGSSGPSPTKTRASRSSFNFVAQSPSRTRMTTMSSRGTLDSIIDEARLNSTGHHGAEDSSAAAVERDKQRVQPVPRSSDLTAMTMPYADSTHNMSDASDDEGRGSRKRHRDDQPRQKIGFATSTSTLTTVHKNGSDAASSYDEEEQVDGKAVNVVVCLRVRPTRVQSASSQIYDFSPTNSSLSFAPFHPTLVKRGAMSARQQDEYEFRFDALHLPPAPTENLYDRKIRPVVRATMNGFNGTVFAYGQTASGKTHTMMGSEAEPGIIPLAVEELFNFIHEQNTHRTYSLRVSFLEIYNESIRDLLATTPRPATAKPLEVVGEDGVVKGLEERPVSMSSEVLSILREGDLRRRVGATDWNERSSRSHSVFVVTIECISKNADGIARVSKLNLIDLAGSESATGQDERRKEGAYINKSLLTLSTVIGKLSEIKSNGPTQHIPYRDSKLTRLLQPALSGKSRIAVICTISPDEQQATETLSTLKFARRAKMVVTKAERGVLMTDAMMLRQYQQQVAALQAQISAKENAADEEELARQLGEAAAKADEYENRSKKAEEELARKDLELAMLRERLQHAQSFMLDGPTLEANARRASLGFASPDVGANSRSLSSVLSPSRRSGKRIVSEVSGLGVGTPSSSRIARVDSGEVKEWSREADLQRQLVAAQERAEHVATLEQELSDLRSQLDSSRKDHAAARDEADKAVRASMDRRDKIKLLEKELAQLVERAKNVDVLRSEATDLRKEQELAFADRDQARAEVAELKKRLQDALSKAEAEVGELKTALADERQDRSRQALELESKQALVVKLEAKVQTAQAKLAEKDALSRDDTRDETIASLKRQLDKATSERDTLTASLERELASIKQELDSVLAAREATVQAARDEAEAALAERDLALQSAKDSAARVVELEELSRIETERHDLAMRLAERERDAASNALRAELGRMTAELEAQSSKATHLQRLVDAASKRDAEQKQYVSNQRAGTDALAARLESLRGRQTPTASLGANNGSSRSTSRMSDGRDDMIAALEARNTDLAVKVEALERELRDIASGSMHSTTAEDSQHFGSSSSTQADRGRHGTSESADLRDQFELQAVVEEQKRVIDETQAEADDWKHKYLAAQRMLDKLNGVDGSMAVESTRSSFADIGNSLSRASLSSVSRPHAPPRTSSSSSYSTMSTRPPAPTSPSKWSKDIPPPLPCSPHNKDKERKTRRVTTTHDIERLKEVRGVSAARELFDSPGSSAAASVTSGLGASTSFRSPARGSLRSKKASYE